MGDNSPLLSICIPTYNRAKYLDECISRIVRQIQESGFEEQIEFLISDNCSTDSTPLTIRKYIDDGANIRYLRNETNIGPDKNFVSCFKNATGNYIWLLGDDDIIMDGALKMVLDQLQDSSIGLVHLKNSNYTNKVKIYTDSKKFLCDVSYWITFISANIFSSRIVKDIDYEKYLGSYFIQVPYYMTAALQGQQNILIDKEWLAESPNAANNGGYNYFQVFIVNYLGIWKEHMCQYPDFKKIYRKEKLRIFKNHIVPFSIQILLRRKKGNFNSEGGYGILLKYYGAIPEAWYYMIKCILITLLQKFKSIF